MKSVKIVSPSNPAKMITVGLCESFYTRLMGFMFKKQTDQYFGLLFPGNSDSRINSSIHMFFVNFNLAVFWLDKDDCIVDKVTAKKWHPVYIPRKAARHILELHENRIDEFNIGDHVKIVYGE